MTGVLPELARLGPVFALEPHPPGSLPAAAWRPLDELLQPGGLSTRVRAVRAALAEASGRSPGAVELRVAASMAQLGLAARLICPALGVAALTGALLDVDPARMRWRAGADATVGLFADATVGLSVPADLVPARTFAANQGLTENLANDSADSADGLPGDLADDLAAALAARWLDHGPVRALVEAARTFGVSEQVLWGNVTSVVHGAVALIGTAAPDVRGRAEAIVAGLLNRPPLWGTYQDSAQAGFRRRSCCLVYRLAGPPTPVCGDCVLELVPGRDRSG